MVSSQWLSRYVAGQRDQVWHELRQLGSAVREHPEIAHAAQAVCDEMARRARQNVEVVVERLSDAGYRFHPNDFDQTPVTPHFPPSASAQEHADWLQGSARNGAHDAAVLGQDRRGRLASMRSGTAGAMATSTIPAPTGCLCCQSRRIVFTKKTPAVVRPTDSSSRTAASMGYSSARRPRRSSHT